MYSTIINTLKDYLTNIANYICVCNNSTDQPYMLNICKQHVCTYVRTYIQRPLIQSMFKNTIYVHVRQYISILKVVTNKVLSSLENQNLNVNKIKFIYLF